MTTETKFTPGPGVVGPVDDTVVTHMGADGKRYEIAQIDGDYNQPETWPVMEANARLIAAAPDLAADGWAFLEAVEALCDWINGNDVVADYAIACPDDYERVSETMVKFRNTLKAVRS